MESEEAVITVSQKLRRPKKEKGVRAVFALQEKQQRANGTNSSQTDHGLQTDLASSTVCSLSKIKSGQTRQGEKTESVIREVQSMGFSSDQLLNALVELELRENSLLQDLTIDCLLQLVLDLSYSSDDSFQHVPEKESTVLVDTEQQTCMEVEVMSDNSEKAKDCIICMEEPAEMAFIPCGHIKTCTPCSDLVMLCPVCRKRIRNRMRIYF